MKVLTALFFAVSFQAVAQSPQVPHKMQFAGMTLTIRDDARREIQKDVDALTQSPRHFNIKVERAKTYFPIIEKIFAEENVPDDFKYLVIQESALIPDAVSTSNAVGFWQFKDFTALEMGLRVDKDIDERLNIVSASRGAARYIKKNNVFFNNWLYALQAYQMGAGGVMKSVTESHSGATHMEITSKTYWYVKKYLAHKVAFEDAVKGRGQIEVLLYENKTKKDLAELAKEVSVDEEQLRSYNKWAKKGTVPDDRRYVVLIPVTGGSSVNLSAVAVASPISQAEAKKGNEKISGPAVAAKAPKINGIPTIIAASGETPSKIAGRANVDIGDFLRWNDISISSSIEQGRPYLLGKKRNRASAQYHKVVAGDDLWKVSQQYGVQMRKLKKFNRMRDENSELAPGTTLWLSATRPKDSVEPVTTKNVVEIDNDTFGWEAGSEAAANVSEPVVKKDPPVTETVKIEPVKQETAVLVVPDSAKTLQAVTTPAPEKDSTFTVVVPDPVLNREEHVVTAKETLYGIARIYNVGVMDLVNWNNLDLQQGIKPGQVLKLKDPAQAIVQPEVVNQETELWHEVKATDTLYSVARKYNVTIKELMDWNSKSDFSLSVGEKLRIVKR